MELKKDNISFIFVIELRLSSLTTLDKDNTDFVSTT